MVEAKFGPQVDFPKQIQALKAQVEAQATAPVLQNASAYQSDGTLGLWVTMSQSGVTQTTWYYGPGTPGVSPVNGLWPRFIIVGQSAAGGSPLGTVLVSLRPDGSESMTIGNQGVGLLDHNGIPIWSESESSFGGIKSPQMLAGGAFQDTNLSTWPGTSNGSWTTIAMCAATINQPQVYINAQGYAPAGVTGQFRITIGGTQVGSTWTATNNNFGSTAQVANVPSGQFFGAAPSCTLDAQVTAGAGTVSGRVWGFIGTASS